MATKYISKFIKGGDTIYLKDSEARDLLLYPVDTDTITPSSTFSKNDTLNINGVIYKAKTDTTDFPVKLMVQGSSFAYNTIDGYRAYVVADSTVSSDWDVYMDISHSYRFAQVDRDISKKQYIISDLSTIRSGASKGATAYQKPTGGIPSTDMTSAVQTSLAKADDAETSIAEIEGKIPSQASSTNQLADKEFVNSSISTSTAEFRGTFTSQSAMEEVTADDNDYAFLVTTDTAGNTVYNRYKWTSTGWVFEYALNNSSFTADQWAAIQSGITQALVTKLSALPTNAELTTALGGKQATISDLSTIRSGAASGATAYQKPSGGIPSTDLASAVQTSLGKADSAYQKPTNGIPSNDMSTAVVTSLGLADSAYQKPSGGIPKTDLVSAVQTSLGKADTAYQKPTNGIPSTDMTSAVQTSLGKADSAYQKASTGIPKSDLASAVQTSLGLADSAVQLTSTITVGNNTYTVQALLEAVASLMSGTVVIKE